MVSRIGNQRGKVRKFCPGWTASELNMPIDMPRTGFACTVLDLVS